MTATRVGATATRVGATATRVGATATRVGATATRVGATATRVGAAATRVGAAAINCMTNKGLSGSGSSGFAPALIYRTAAALLFAALLLSACAPDKGSPVDTQPVQPVAETTDPEILSALELVKKMPDSASSYTNLASVYIRRVRYLDDFTLNEKAQTAIDKALVLDPNHIEARKIQASLHLTFHRFREGLDAGRKLFEEIPEDPFVHGVLTDANVELGNYEEAVKSAQKMIDLRPNSASYARVGHVRTLHGDHKGAIEMYTQAAKTADPMDKEAQAWCLGQIGSEYLRHGNVERADKVYDEALGIFPRYHVAYEGKARTSAARNDWPNAIKYADESQNGVDDLTTNIFLGDIHKRLGNEEMANHHYQIVERLGTEAADNDGKIELALFWADKDINLDAALEIAQRINNQRKDVFTADILAWCLYKKGRFAEAKQAIESAMRINTPDARIFYHAAMIEKELGNKSKASEYLLKTLKLNPAFDVLQSQIALSEKQKLAV